LILDQIVIALEKIFHEDRYADKVIDSVIKSHRKWGARDRRFFAEYVYEIVRWRRPLEFIVGHPHPDPIDYFKAQFFRLHNELPNDLDANLDLWDKRLHMLNRAPRAVQESIPDWMDQYGEKAMGDRWTAILHSLNEPATQDLRANPLLTTRAKLSSALAEEGIVTHPISGLDNGLVLHERKNVFVTNAFKVGHFEMQDRASQLVAPFLQVEPGHRVIDACAGAGGKSLHIASLMKNKGKVLSLDIQEWKLKELKTRAKRNKIDVIETRWIENSKVTKRLENSADRLLLDVPCSGIGVIRRNPDTKWKLSGDEIERLKKLQQELLTDYSPMLKIGGKMVYSTCSFLPDENEKQIETFLNANKNFVLEEQVRIDPDQGRGDGFFMARLIKQS
jgi:16S rRNA (cytosine967-C5)-methyltransferase